MNIADLRKLIPAISDRLEQTAPRQLGDRAEFADRLRRGAEARLDHVAAAAERWRRDADLIDTALSAIADGAIEKVESEERQRKYQERQSFRESSIRRGNRIGGLRGLGLERMLRSTSDFLSVEFFEAGIDAARGVGRIKTIFSFGTGFLVGNDLLITNNHVIDSAEFAFGSRLELDAEENRIGPPKQIQVFSLDPDRFFATSPELDFTIVAVNPESDLGAPLSGYGYHPLIAGEGKIRIGDSVNVIQHPGAGPKNVVVHDSQLIFLSNEIEDDQFCFYTSDTDEGSSGAPVFNNRWEVIALHHSSVPKVNTRGDLIDRHGKIISKQSAHDSPESIVWIANEGVRVSRLVAGLKALELNDPMSQIREDLLALWSEPVRARRSFPESLPSQEGAQRRPIELGDGEATIPINLTVSFRP